MGIVAAISNVQTMLSSEASFQIELLVTLSLVFSLSMALLVSDSKYWNRWASSTLEACTYPFLITFEAIVAFKIMIIL